MNLIVKKSLILQGTCTPPSSKSQSVRGLIFALLASGESHLENILSSDDIDDASRICKNLGAELIQKDSSLSIRSSGIPLRSTAETLFSGNSGITTRFILPILGLRQNTEKPIILDCGAQMQARPIHSLIHALRELGMTIEYLKNEKTLPIKISGELKGGKTEVDGITSQYLSALLISLPLASHDSEITVTDLHERPYVEMTLEWLNQRHIHYRHEQKNNKDIFYIQGKQTYQPFNATIPADFSSASYLIAAGALTAGTIQLHGLNMQDPQGDKRLVTLLQDMGADIIISENQLTVHGGKKLKGIAIDANDIPDLLPTLAVIGTQAEGQTHIHNVKQARLKETDRIHSMTEGLTRLGAKIIEEKDGMVITQSQLTGSAVKGYDDHRTVMALSLAGMLADGVTQISDAEAINKTFPGYVKMMNRLGAIMEITHD